MNCKMPKAVSFSFFIDAALFHTMTERRGCQDPKRPKKLYKMLHKQLILSSLLSHMIALYEELSKI